MAFLARAGVLAVLLASGCTAQAVNQAQVYKPVTGVVQMEIKIPPGESVVRVQFQVNDKVVAEDEDPTDGYKAEIDTADLEPDVLAKIAAVGVRANGSNVVLRENFILIGAPAEDEEDEDDPEPTEDDEPDATEDDEDAVGGEVS
jgi:hypothetical protein